ncbi:MAG TPA: electron transfer flavoprotein subunit beta, partial [Candidatus Latescibacteria bacterium]|nr:electron transfer flavoprotein subunit beta [Candidatus Latescibacterota bacterium]
MKIAACVKWVPVVARMKFDTETRRLVREGVPSELNGYDVIAVQRAVELKQSTGAEITVYTMGPDNARQGLVR